MPTDPLHLRVEAAIRESERVREASRQAIEAAARLLERVRHLAAIEAMPPLVDRPSNAVSYGIAAPRSLR